MNAQSATTKDQPVIATARSVKQSLRVLKALLVCICLLSGIAVAQSQPTAPAKAATPSPSLGAYNYFGRTELVGGTGASVSSDAAKPIVQCGIIFSFPLFEFEAGAMGSLVNESKDFGYLSTKFFPLVPWKDMGNRRGFQLAVGGYTLMFQTSNALNYGLAFAHPVDNSQSIQFEIRDYWEYSNPSQHNVVFRIVWLIGQSD